MNRITLILGAALALLLAGLGSATAYYRAEMQEARKASKTRSAQLEAAQDSLRVLHKTENRRSYGRLSFPSEDSLLRFAKSNFGPALQPDSTGPKLEEGDASTGAMFAWQPDFFRKDSVATPIENDEGSTLFRVDVSDANYTIRGEFFATGYAGGHRTLQYDLSVRLKPQTFRLLRREGGPSQELYIQAPGQIISSRAYHNPETNTSSRVFRPTGRLDGIIAGKNVFALATGGVEIESEHFSAGLGIGPARSFRREKTVLGGIFSLKAQF